MKKIALLFLLLNSVFLFAQKEISGKVTDKMGNGLPGVNVNEKNSKNGVSTDMDGNYKIKVKEGATLLYSYVGYLTVSKTASANVINVTLNEDGGQNLQEVVVTGSRNTSRTNTKSALPVDILSAKELVSTGQATFDKALQYRIPSFNTVQTPVNDATSLLDPYEIRNLGPSRTLILINGKRKNMSSLVYVQTSPGRGETGADISAIPTDAIQRVEILRDGASAQYGSDAIAGVMNIILKKNINYGSVTYRGGVTSKGDGAMNGFSINNGSSVGKKGFVNYTIDFSKVNLANRPGTVDAAGDAGDFGADINVVKAFLAKKPDAGNVNGSPETTAAKFLVNGGFELSDNTELYYNAAYVYKKVNSFANYRTPYWRTLADYPYLKNFFGNGTDESYLGYVPTFIGDLNDYNATIGYKSTIDDWTTDASITFGGNQQIYSVTNSQNRSDLTDGSGNNIYKENSPISFKPGGTNFNHIVGNIDISRNISDEWSIALGSEFRTENFEVIAGDKASWDGIGADSFAGNTPENSGKWNRFNLGVYASTKFTPVKEFEMEGTLRHEHFSDFGPTTIGKISAAYTIEDKVTLKGSYSTGFRAPSLHQIYTQKSQYSFVPGQGIQVSGIINNVSPQARLLGIPSLTAEKSTNITFGTGVNFTNRIKLTLDYYNITVKDRIVLSDRIKSPLGDLAFFANAFDSRTSGIDFVFGYSKIDLGSGTMNLNLAGNYTLENKRISDVKNASFGRIQDALMFSSRPNTKWILGGDYTIDKFNFSLNGTYFGKTTFRQDGLNENLRTEFIPKMVTDLGITYNVTPKFTISANVNNLFNVLPEWKYVAENAAGDALLKDAAFVKSQTNLITFNGRYSQMTYDGSHFSQLGTMFNFALNYKF